MYYRAVASALPNASPRSVACGKSRDKLIERANVAHFSGGVPRRFCLEGGTLERPGYAVH